MIGRDFYKHLKLLGGRSETIRTRFEFDSAGRLVEHIGVWTQDGRPTRIIATPSGLTDALTTAYLALTGRRTSG